MELSTGDVSTSRRYVSAEQIEDVVRQLKDVVSARAVLGSSGRVDELHVLVNPKRAPKQVARDIESAVRAHLDFTLDYKKISIAQIQGRSALAGGGTPGTTPAGLLRCRTDRQRQPGGKRQCICAVRRPSIPEPPRAMRRAIISCA